VSDDRAEPSTRATPADRASARWIALVFVAMTALCAQTAWWSWQAPPEALDRQSTWSLLHGLVVVVANQLAWSRWVLVAGAAVMALAAAGAARLRAWGWLLALLISATLIAGAILARYAAVFSEPRQYVSRSHYVHAATVVAVVALIGHGPAAILAVRLLCRRPVALALVRVALVASALLLAAVPAAWLHAHAPGGAHNAAMVCACAAVALAALAAAGLPRRVTALVALAVSLAGLAVLTAGLVAQLGEHPRRGGMYSRAAEQAIAEVAVAAPLVLATLGLCIVLRYQIIRRSP